MTRVLCPLNSPQIGGGNRSMLTLWRGLAPHGFVPLAVLSADGPMRRACAAAGVEADVVGFAQPEWRRPASTLRAWFEWRRVVARFEPDLVHSNDLHSARSAALAVRGLPHVCHVRSAVDPAYAAWAFRGLPRPDVFVFNSHAMFDAHREVFERVFPRARLVAVHNGVDLSAFRPAPPHGGPRPRLGVVGNLLPVKGHLDFLEMARRLEDAGADAEYWIVGEELHGDGTRARIEARCRELRLDERTTFFGHRDDVPDLIAGMDVVVCPSHVEPFGRVLIEAMASERPVVATRVGGIPEVVEDGVTGWLVPPGSPADLADRALRLLSNAELRASMGRAGRLRAERCFGLEAHAQRIREVYAGLRSRPIEIAAAG